MTGVGKTASAYYLKNQPLIGRYNMSKGIVYEAEQGYELNSNARMSSSSSI